MTAYAILPVFWVLVENTASEKYNYKLQITSKRKRWPDVGFIDNNKKYHSTAD